jgi:hypothetical protein
VFLLEVSNEYEYQGILEYTYSKWVESTSMSIGDCSKSGYEYSTRLERVYTHKYSLYPPYSRVLRHSRNPEDTYVTPHVCGGFCPKHNKNTATFESL